KGAKTEDEDPIRHLFAASTHDYLLFFTNRGKVYWQKVYDLPQLSRESRGRAIVNLLNLSDGETIADCRAVRDFTQPDHYLLMATRRGLVKKTPLSQYGRPQRNGIIAIKLKENDELVDVVVARTGDEVVLSTARGMAIRFRQSDARPMGRNSSGVKGIKLGSGDELVGMVVADPDATLLTVCRNGYGKRTDFGPNSPALEEERPGEAQAEDEEGGRTGGVSPPVMEADDEADESSDDAGGVSTPVNEPEEEGDESGEEGGSSTRRYRTQHRGGKGLRDIKATERNGPVVSIVSVRDDDELLMMTARGKLQRIVAGEISSIGRNTQGVRIMSLDEGDTLAAAVRVPRDEGGEDAVQVGEPIAEPPSDAPGETPE
ncbi:MAG TPA: DNA gyrase C-terminal beta-propeller domain-containing protein, partial [Pirellulales bacterium]|nr:DNA gyrase C-terminal beta-propeller domain-containing protein [Pirellulales bacterium]